MIEQSVRQGTDEAKREVHHEAPRCLLRLRDRADDHTDLDGEAIQKWLDYELEALRWGVDPDVTREELAELVESSTVDLSRDEHRKIHVGDFARWGRRGGLRTLALYGRPYFSLLARYRWGRVEVEALVRHREAVR